MKNIDYLLLLPLLIFGACQVTTIKEPNLAEKIQGDWVGDLGIFSFEDSLAVCVYEYREYVHYKLKEDTLIINRWSINEDEEQEQYHFLIDSVSENHLSLKSLTPSTEDMFRTYEYNIETENFENKETTKGATQLTVKKTKEKNKTTFKRIGFTSVNCPKRCTKMYLEIDSLGNFYFQGRRNTRKQGFWFGKLGKEDLDILTKKIRAIELDSLKEIYKIPYDIPVPLSAIEIVTSDGVYKSEVYGITTEPIELRFLFNKLMNLYNYITLEKDSTVQDKFQFEELQKTFAPPLPPPPPPLRPSKIKEK